MIFEDKRILITGGTGSLGTMVLKTILSGVEGVPKRIRIFSRDEQKQYELAKSLDPQRTLLDFRLGDIRCFESVSAALSDIDIVIHAAAYKHVPACENDPLEAVKTNVMGPANIVRAIKEHRLPVQTVLGISTDKACSPICVMGMTKALQERILIQANVNSTTRFFCIRYGNMLESRGSVVPLFRAQIAAGGPVTITHSYMTRFLVPLKDAATHLIVALNHCNAGEIYIPQMRSTFIEWLADAMIGNSGIKKKYTGIRPGEKLEDIIISKFESPYVIKGEGYFILQPSLEFFGIKPDLNVVPWEYGSAGTKNLMETPELLDMLERARG
jgi:UDP-glucose 4-epimerase